MGRAGGEYIGFFIKPGDPAPSNHNITVSILKNFPGFNSYLTCMLEDTDFNIEMQFVHNSVWLFGIHKPELGGNSALSLRTELVRSGPRAYRHGIYQDGHAINGRVLGFGLGPDVLMLKSSLSHLSNTANLLTANLQYLKRSGNSYRVITKGNGDFIDLETTDRRPSENHYIIDFNWIVTMSELVNFNINFGLDHVVNKNFETDNSKIEYMLEFTVDIFPIF